MHAPNTRGSDSSAGRSGRPLPHVKRSGLAGLLIAFAPTAGAQSPATATEPSAMAGLEGPYTMTREGSGTSWQPDSTPMGGIHATHGEWMTMLHAMAAVVYDHQGGPRGATETFSSGMLMVHARRELSNGAFGWRVMASTDPAMGRSGYPMLFQTGETANGRDPLIDRQHPHDLLMEAAATSSLNLSPQMSVFLYAGLPGSPALGPNAYMHRLSGVDNPEAPLAHHWLDSTHIAWGVLTGGYTWRHLRLEASAFNGREPDQNRYNLELRALDSYSARVAYNPTRDWSLQLSRARLASPEQLQPGVSVRRTTASASYNAPLRLGWQTTLAWGRNTPSAGHSTDAWLLESALKLARAHTLFGRIERVDKDELFLPGAALFDHSFTIERVSLGYICDFAHLGPLDLGLGALISTYSYPAALNVAYGARPSSFMVFMRARL